MVLCEHFIYTSGIVNDKSGYQIISKSAGITDEMILELENYLYPLGVNLSEFSISKSQIILKDHVAFTKVRNIGIGFDGRPDTLYSHSIIMKKKDFKKFHNDSRIFDDEYIENTKSVHITPILIDEKKLSPDFSCVDELGITKIKKIIAGLLNEKKISLVDVDSIRLIQSFLSLLPSSLRFLSYSTNVAEPKRQPKYDIIQIKKNNLIKIPNSIVIDKEIDFEKNFDDLLLHFCVDYFLKIIDSKDSKKLLAINQKIDSVSNDMPTRLIVGVSSYIISEDPYKFSKQYLPRLQTILDEFDDKNLVVNQLLINLNDIHNKQESGEFEIEKILSKYNEEKLNITTIGKMFGELSDDDKELRNTLFHRLVKKRIYDFKTNGSEILQKSIDRYYNNEIIRGFIVEPKLNFAFENVFSNSRIKNYEKINLFSIAIKQALCSNIEFLEELFKFTIHNLDSDDDVLKLNEDVRWLISSKEFHQNFQPEKILKILSIIQNNIISVFPRNEKSGTIDRKYYYMEEILNILLNTSQYLLTMRRFELDSNKNKIKEFEHNLYEFLSQHTLPNTKPINWFNLDLSDRVSSLFVWRLFLALSYRCN